MNAAEVITEDMTLDEKLAAIDKAMQNAQAVAKEQGSAPIDPATATMCEGCQ